MDSRETELRAAFLRLLTTDSETKDRRRREFNQAIFNAEGGWAVWSSTDLAMVMEKFDKAVAALSREAVTGERPEPPHPCWFCGTLVSMDKLIAGYDTFEEQRLACLACDERMRGNWPKGGRASQPSIALDALRALSEAATPGPWEVEDNGDGYITGQVIAKAHDYAGNLVSRRDSVTDPNSMTAADADFIVAATAYVRALLEAQSPAAPSEPPPDVYEAWVGRVADAIHETCRNEWRAIVMVDPKRQFTQHGTDAHYGMAHDLVRRLGLAAQPAPTAGLDVERLAEALRSWRNVVYVDPDEPNRWYLDSAKAIAAEYAALRPSEAGEGETT